MDGVCGVCVFAGCYVVGVRLGGLESGACLELLGEEGPAHGLAAALVYLLLSSTNTP